MYISRRVIDNQLEYVLCESYHNGVCLSNRELLTLGSRPDRFILYPGGSCFYIDDALFELLQEQGVSPSYDEVEKLFHPFLDPYIRTKIEPFLHRHHHRRWRPMPEEERARILQETHIFDRRRIHYLRFGQVDQRRLDASLPLFKKLLQTSRDEREQLLLNEEQALSPGEYKRYVFTIFDLQRFFSESYSRIMPQALNEERMDACFLQSVCALDQDQKFWQGLQRTVNLPPYLVRYVVMYFDFDFPGGEDWDATLRSFAESRRRARLAKGSASMSVNEASTVFGVSRAELAAMDKKALTKAFRKKAHELHPDKGGDHDRFVALTTAYNSLLQSRK